MSVTSPGPSATAAPRHGTFGIERHYAFAREKVFAAWADPRAKSRWFVAPDEWVTSGHRLDFREGGEEFARSGPPGGTVHAYHAIYYDIVPNERIVYAYEMHLDGSRLSVSLTTVEFRDAGAGTTLVFTEQGVFLDGTDSCAEREQGTRDLLANLEAELARTA